MRILLSLLVLSMSLLVSGPLPAAASDDRPKIGLALSGGGTPLGPLYLAYGMAEDGNNTFYLYLGSPFVAEGARPLD